MVLKKKKKIRKKFFSDFDLCSITSTEQAGEDIKKSALTG